MKQKIALLLFPPKNSEQSALETRSAHLLCKRPSRCKSEPTVRNTSLLLVLESGVELSRTSNQMLNEYVWPIQ